MATSSIFANFDIHASDFIFQQAVSVTPLW